MKFNAQYVIPIVILVVVVFISLCQSCAYFKPYDPEGYENIHVPLSVGDVNEKGNVAVSNVPSQVMNSALASSRSDGDNGVNNMETPIPGSGMLYNTMNQSSDSTRNDSINTVGTPVSNSGMLYNTMNQSSDSTRNDSINTVGTPIPGSGMLYNTMNQSSDSTRNDSINTVGTPISNSGMLYNTMNQAASAPVMRTTFSGREGFATLNDVSADYAKDDKTIDVYSQAKGGMSCEPGPYANSAGYLCLDDNQQAQLHTRGGNQTGHA